MTTPAILDADMATVTRWLRSGFDWWVEELAGMAPAAVRERFSPQPAVTAHYAAGAITLTRRGAPVARGAPASRSKGMLPVALALPAETVLARDVTLPALGVADMRQLVALDADRLLPFAPGTALVDFSARPAFGGSQSVRVAGLPLHVADAALAAARAEDLDVRQLRVDGGGAAPAFDFLPAWRAAHAVPANPTRRIWWAIVGLMFLLNLMALIGRDIQALRAVEALVETHGQTASTARQLRARVIAEDSRRRSLIERRRVQDPLPLLAEATRLLPAEAWVQRLGWDGKRLRLAGYKASGIDVVAVLRRSPLLADVRSTATDVPAQGTTQPFDISADRRR